MTCTAANLTRQNASNSQLFEDNAGLSIFLICLFVMQLNVSAHKRCFKLPEALGKVWFNSLRELWEIFHVLLFVVYLQFLILPMLRVFHFHGNRLFTMLLFLFSSIWTPNEWLSRWFDRFMAVYESAHRIHFNVIYSFVQPLERFKKLNWFVVFHGSRDGTCPNDSPFSTEVGCNHFKWCFNAVVVSSNGL